MSPDGKLPKGALLDARPTIEFASKQYDIVRGLDAQNEKRPRKNWAALNANTIVQGLQKSLQQQKDSKNGRWVTLEIQASTKILFAHFLQEYSNHIVQINF